MLSVYWQVPRQQAEPDSRTAVEEENCACGTLGVASKKPILSPRKTKTEGKKRHKTECAEECRTHFGRSEKSHCSSSTPAPRSAPENCSHHTHRHFVKVDQPLRSATLLSSCARRWRDAGRLKKVQQICSEKGLFLNQWSFQKNKKKKRKERKYVF